MVHKNLFGVYGFADYLLPLYQREGKRRLMIAIGCGAGALAAMTGLSFYAQCVVAGVTGGRLLAFAAANVIGGFEPFSGIPTSVGGGIAMNAGVKELHFGDVTERVIAAEKGILDRVDYSAAKGGVLSLTRALALETGKYNINVNCVCPGIVRTNIWERALDDIRRQGGDAEAYFASRLEGIPLKRAQTMEDIAHMFLYLSSDFADNMTGQAINITGGKVMH